MKSWLVNRDPYNSHLVGGFNPFESNWMISPNRGENKTYLKTPPSHGYNKYNPVTKNLGRQISSKCTANNQGSFGPCSPLTRAFEISMNTVYWLRPWRIHGTDIFTHMNGVFLVGKLYSRSIYRSSHGSYVDWPKRKRTFSTKQQLRGWKTPAKLFVSWWKT